MKVTQVYEVRNNEVLIRLPAAFKNQKSVRVTVEDAVSVQEKRARMRKAGTDPLFLADIQSVQADFNGIEFENL